MQKSSVVAYTQMQGRTSVSRPKLSRKARRHRTKKALTPNLKRGAYPSAGAIFPDQEWG